MISLVLAVVSSALISIIMRFTSDKVEGNLSMLAANYIMCSLLGACFSKFQLVPVGEKGFSITIGLGVIAGVLFLVSFVLFQENTRKNGVVLSAIFMKLGLLVPMIVSIFLFREMPSGLQWIGFGIAVVAIIVINYKTDGGKSGFGLGLLLLLLVGGSGDVMAKIFEVYGPEKFSELFLFYTFMTALALCIVLVIRKKEKFGYKELLFGAIIGVPNFFSSKFLIDALKDVPAVVAYPSYNVATILIVTLAGVFVFREKLTGRQWGALGAIMVALIMLNI